MPYDCSVLKCSIHDSSVCGCTIWIAQDRIYWASTFATAVKISVIYTISVYLTAVYLTAEFITAINVIPLYVARVSVLY